MKPPEISRRIINHERRISIKPGEFYVSGEEVIITTLLGSCVAACLYDPVMRIAGMNHFLLGNRRYSKDMPIAITEAGRYGIYAMELLINEMMKLGAQKYNLRAKVFGGGSVIQTPADTDNFFCVGDVNRKFILEFLRNEGLPLVASDLGGDRGRVIYFCADDYSVYVRKIRKTVNYKLVQREKTFWQKSIEKQEQQAAIQPDIWL
ncbi:MAG: chemotaxis protein CheD [Thermodesulfovibrio sp.]|nr:chemotaxis protein CheD [Thermodesulfovibrio sp.]